MATHTLSIEDLTAWLNEPRWELYASSGGYGFYKRLEIGNGGSFRVIDRSTVTYHGDDMQKAVQAYNEAP